MKHNHAAHAGLSAPGSMQGWGRFYDLVTRLFFMGQEKPVRNKCIELANIKPGDQVLEVGCGTGSLSRLAKMKAGPEGQVTGIDVASDMLDTARKKAQQANLEINYKLGKIQAIPAGDNSIDVVLSSLMFHHVPGLDQKKQGLKEIYRVLKPGGRLMIMDYEGPKQPLQKMVVGHLLSHGMANHSNAHLPALVTEAGFSSVQVVPTRFGLLAFLVAVK